MLPGVQVLGNHNGECLFAAGFPVIYLRRATRTGSKDYCQHGDTLGMDSKSFINGDASPRSAEHFAVPFTNSTVPVAFFWPCADQS